MFILTYIFEVKANPGGQIDIKAVACVRFQNNIDPYYRRL